MEEKAGSLFEGFAAASDPNSTPDVPSLFFGRYRRNPALPFLALLVSLSVWPWFVHLSNLYSEYEAERRRLDPWAPGSDPSDLTRATSDVAVSAGVATSVVWWIVAGLVIAACVVVGLFAAYAHSAEAPRGTLIFGIGLVILWAVAAILLRAEAVSTIATLRGLAVT